ncbi:MAG: hypothetical protein IJ844_03125, partial [Prevotella sp.]|nr:hypothetical protein [Prevotella sp.]
MDDAAQIQFEDYELKQQYTYHIVDAQNKSTVLEVATTAVEGGINVGGMASSYVPDVLKRKGAKLVYFDEHATNVAQNATTPVNVYTTGYELFQLGFQRNIYVGYEIDEEDLGFKYSGTLAELSSLTDDDLEDLNWNLWELEHANKSYFYSQSDGEQILQSGQKTTRPTDEKYFWAFFGDPYRTKIINKATGAHAYLSVSTNKPGNNPQPYEAYMYMSSDKTNYKYNSWGYAVHTDKVATEPKSNNYAGQFFLNGVTWTGNAYSTDYHNALFFVDGRGWPRTLALQLGDQEYKIVPLIPYTYHIINQSGKDALSVTMLQPKTNATLSANTAFGFYPYRWDGVKYYDADGMTISGGTYTVKDGATEYTSYNVASNVWDVDIYVKFGVNQMLKTADHFDGTRVATIRNNAGDYLYVDTDGSIKATTGTPENKKRARYLWKVIAQPTTSNGDNCDVLLYNFTDLDHPLSLSTSDPSQLQLGEQTDALRFVLSYSAGVKSSDVESRYLIVHNSAVNNHQPYTFLSIDGSSHTPVLLHEKGKGVGSGQEAPLYIEIVDLSYTYHIYNFKGEKAIGRQLTNEKAVATGNLQVPIEIKSALLADDAYHYWQDAARTIPITSLDDCDASGNIYVTYDYLNDVNGTIDLSGEIAYNIYSPIYAVQTYNNDGGRNAYWCYPGIINNYNYVRIATPKSSDEDTYVRSQAHNRSNPSHTFTGIDDQMLWSLNGNDPYDITLINASQPSVVLSRAGEKSDGYFQIKEGGKPLKLILANSSNDEGIAAGDYEFIIANGDNTIRRTWVYHENSPGFDHVTTRDDIDTKFHRVHLIPRSVDYNYNIINMSGEKALVYTGKGVEGKNAEQLPPAVQSPMAQNFKFYQKSQFDINTVGGVTTYTLKSGEEPYELFPPTTNADGETIVPELYALYEPKTVEDVNLEGGRYYYLKAAGKYAHTDSYGTALDVADNPTKTAP